VTCLFSKLLLETVYLIIISSIFDVLFIYLFSFLLRDVFVLSFKMKQSYIVQLFPCVHICNFQPLNEQFSLGHVFFLLLRLCIH
jgi:hypothetical protein